MAISRATSLMRTRIGGPIAGFTPSRAAAAPPLRNHQQIRMQHHDGDLGGPGGQTPRPSKPAGADTIKRNWMQIGGAAVAIVAIYAYFTSGKPSKGEIKAKSEEGVDAAKKRAQELKDKGEEGLRKLEGKGGVGEMSGRKGNMGGFRGE